MATRRQLANAIRVLAMDSVQKQNLVTLVHQWGWRILLKCYGATFKNTIQPILNGLIEIVLYFLTAMVLC